VRDERRNTGLGWVWPLLLLAAAGIVVVFPAGYVVRDVVLGLLRGAQRPVPLSGVLVGRTVAVVVVITVLATALGWPAAWASRRLPGRALVILLVPMLLPSYLAYAGWGPLRAPGTWLGDLLLRGPPGAGAGANWYPVVAGRVQAVLGLVLWVWPLAAVVMAMAVRRIDQSVLDSMRMESLAWWRRVLETVRMARVGVAAALGVVGLVMLGSAVPLHVAQFDTLAIGLWRRMDEIPYQEHWRIWAGFWPLILIAIGGAWTVSRRIGPGEAAPVTGGEQGSWLSTASIAAAAVWGLSVLVPLGLLLANLRHAGSLLTFLKANRSAVISSAVDSTWVAVIAAAMACAVWFGLGNSARWRRATVLACGLFLVAGLVPGILVGSATAHAWGSGGWFGWVGDSRAIVVLGHLGRFGCVACLGGWLLARTEPAGVRDLRLIDAGGSGRGWAESAFRPRIGIIVALALAAGMLSFHEIEATVMLQPPSSSGGGFAWKLLQALHFNREEDLVAAMLLVVGAGLAAAALVLALWPRAAGPRRGVPAAD